MQLTGLLQVSGRKTCSKLTSRPSRQNNHYTKGTRPMQRQSNTGSTT